MAFLSTLSSMALQVSGVDATTQQGPAQNDGYEPYGTVWVMPTLYRLHGNAGMTPQVYKFYGTGVVLLECRHNSTSSMAPQECPTILQVLWHRCGTAGVPTQFYGATGVPHNSTSSMAPQECRHNSTSSVAPQERRHNSTSPVALRRSGVSKGDNGRRGHQGGPLRQKATDKDAETIIRSDEH